MWGSYEHRINVLRHLSNRANKMAQHTESTGTRRGSALALWDGTPDDNANPRAVHPAHPVPRSPSWTPSSSPRSPSPSSKPSSNTAASAEQPSPPQGSSHASLPASALLPLPVPDASALVPPHPGPPDRPHRPIQPLRLAMFLLPVLIAIFTALADPPPPTFNNR